MALWIIPGPIGQTIFFLSKAWLLLFPVVWWGLVDKQRIVFDRPTRVGLLVGLASGVVIAGIMFGAYYAFGHNWVEADHVKAIAAKSGLGVLWVYIPMALGWCLVNSLMEEYVWRWFVFDKCERLMSVTWAVVAAAFFFTIHHVIALGVQVGWQLTVVGSLGVFVGSCIWSALRHKYGTIWPGYVSHVIADVPIFFIGYLLIFH